MNVAALQTKIHEHSYFGAEALAIKPVVLGPFFGRYSS